MPEIVFDSCVLSNFSFTDSLFILKKMYGGSAFLTDFVSAEIQRGIQAGQGALSRIEEAITQGWLKEIAVQRKEERALWQNLSVSLGLGEASSTAVAKARGFHFACDDRAARKEALRLEVRLTGTVGILKKAVRRRVISLTAADRILAGMKAAGFFSPVNSLRELRD